MLPLRRSARAALAMTLVLHPACGLAPSWDASAGRAPPPASSFPKESFNKKKFFWHEVLHVSARSGARVGRLHTPHGVVDTPGFVAVATNAALKGVDIKAAAEAGQQLIFANSYHLMLQPGPEVIEAAGGIQRFMRHNGPMITDSGGFQIFSLAANSVHADVGEISRSRGSGSDGGVGGAGDGDGSGEDGGGGNDSVADPHRAEVKTETLKSEMKRANPMKNSGKVNDPNGGGNGKLPGTVVRVTEEGVVFRSYVDGKHVTLTPESTVQAQKQYGSDIIIPLDELPPFHTSPERLEASVLRTHRWEERSLREHLKDPKEQAMYGVVHGGIDKVLRQLSVDYLSALPFDGYAIGGSLGSCREELVDLLTFVVPSLPKDKPNHLLGIADEGSIHAAVPLGVDTFDSCFPTRLARHGTLLTRDAAATGNKLHVGNKACATAFGVPICLGCKCTTCRDYDLAYLHHLKKAKEPLLWQLASIHNLAYMNDLMADIRAKIMNDEI